MTNTSVQNVVPNKKISHLAADAEVAAKFLNTDNCLVLFAATGSSKSFDLMVSHLSSSLRSLRLTKCGEALRDDHMITIGSCSSLEDLDVSFSSISDLGMKVLFGLSQKHPPPNPKILNLRGCEALTDASLAILAEHGTNLVDLDLELLWRLTAEGVALVAQNITTLKRLYLRGAASVLRKKIRDDLIPLLPHLTIYFGPRFKLPSDARRGNLPPLRPFFHNKEDLLSHDASS